MVEENFIVEYLSHETEWHSNFGFNIIRRFVLNVPCVSTTLKMKLCKGQRKTVDGLADN